MTAPDVVDRSYSGDVAERLAGDGMHPVLARVYAARGVTHMDELDLGLSNLLPPETMRNLPELGRTLADAIEASRRLLIVADYDCDGATACAVGVLALRSLGGRVDYLVPNRFEFGYGLTPEIVRLAAQGARGSGAERAVRPDILITVDNGIASVEGVAEANRLGLQVLVTDHHLPGDTLPDAACIVNPNQAGCPFPSKSLAGVGVMFYAMLQLRSELRGRAHFQGRDEPNLAGLLDLVALGTVADVVRLDRNNRVLVEQGLRRIRAGRCRPGIRALLELAGRQLPRTGAYDLGFVLGPRINAAGRLSDMSVGIECLLADESERAVALARQLDQLNQERRNIESQMQERAFEHLEQFDPGSAFGLSLYDPEWHQGVIGILAARIRERFHRPVIAFARGTPGELKGSGRSIPGLHLRDALDLVTKHHPDLILRFGGHAAAAGVAIRENDLARFQAAFEAVLRGLLVAEDLRERLDTDGTLGADQASLELAEAITSTAWGQGFPPPRFRGAFRVVDQRVVGGAHLKLQLAWPRASRPTTTDAVLFRHSSRVPEQIETVYRLDVNEWNSSRAVQLVVEHWQPAP